jgi:hypothetical protein
MPSIGRDGGFDGPVILGMRDAKPKTQNPKRETRKRSKIKSKIKIMTKIKSKIKIKIKISSDRAQVLLQSRAGFDERD